MGLYMSVQRVRFRSAHDYELFKPLLAMTPEYLRRIPGFRQWTWWVHPDDPLWFLEMHVWDDTKAMTEWYLDGFHKYLRAWGVKGPIIEDIVTHAYLDVVKLLRVCPLCQHPSSTEFAIEQEQAALAQPCSNCGAKFPVASETPDGFVIYGNTAPVITKIKEPAVA